MGFAYAEGIGHPRWTLGEWVDALAKWIEARVPLAKGRLREGNLSATRAYPNWLAPHEIEAWKFARDRAGLRIDGIEDSVRAKLRSILANTITLAKPRAQTVALVREQLQSAFAGVEKDWDRIAVTELAGAFNEGVVTAAGGSGVRRFRVVTQTGACKTCREAYDGVEFTTETLIPVMPPSLHPRCRCAVQPVR
jgi:hypothetical protein